MKKIVLGIIVVLHFFYCVATDQENFLQANEMYSKKEFKQALYVYQRIDNKGAAVWFNMGNCWYHLKQYVDALVCWKRALKYGGTPWHTMVLSNCNKVYSMLNSDLHELSWYEAIVFTIVNHSLLWWQLIFLCICYIFFMILLYLQGKRLVMLSTLCICLITMTGTCLGIKYNFYNGKSAMVKQACWLMAGTDERFSKICMLKEGQEVTLMQELHDGWSKIKNNGYVGWVLAENIEYI